MKGRHTRKDPNNMLLIELNEFNSELLRSVAEAHRLKHIEQVLNWHHARTWTRDEYETGSLGPRLQGMSKTASE